MSRFAFVIKLFQNKNFHGGGEKVFFKLIEYLAKKGHLIDVYCTSTNVEPMNNINVFIVDALYNHEKPEIMEEFYNTVKLMLKDKDYKHIISENFSPPLDITIIHGHSIKHRMNFKPFLLKILYNFRKVKRTRMAFEDKCIKQSYNKIFAVSELQKQDFIKNLGANPDIIKVVPLAHDGMKNFINKNYDRNSKLIFGASMVGFSIKGGYTLINALKYLKNFDFEVKIIYPKWKKNLALRFLLKLWNLEKKVKFISFQSDMEDFYKDLDVMLIPSREDTFNLTTLEAMSRGIVPVVSTRAGSYEILTDKKDGFVFEYDKSADKNLTNIMQNILSNPDILIEIRKNTYETAKKYEWKNLCEQFEMEILK